MGNKERLYWNVVKGVAVFLMLWGHCIQYCALDVVDFFNNPVFKIIYSFHMPLFMLVSGYLFYSSFCKRDLKILLVHRIQGMLYPIVFCTVVNNLLKQIPILILSDRFNLFFGTLFVGVEDSLWFLWSVLLCSIPVGVAYKVTKNILLQILLLLLGGVFLALFPQWNTSLYMYPFFVAGFLWAMYRSALPAFFRKLEYAAFVVFPVMLIFFEMKHYIYVTPVYSATLGLAETLKINLFRWTIGFAGSICLMIVLRFVTGIDKLSGFLKIVAKAGENSLQIYCLSVSLLSDYLPHLYRKLMEPFGCNLFAQNMTVYNLVFTPLVAMCYAVGLYFLICLLRRMRLDKLIFGR